MGWRGNLSWAVGTQREGRDRTGAEVAHFRLKNGDHDNALSWYVVLIAHLAR